MDAMQTNASAVVLDRVTKTYRSKAGKVPALRDVTYAFPRGSFTAVMGPSGSGKSTLLQCAAGLDRPSSGRVLLGDTDLGMLDAVRLTKLRRARMGFVFQAYNLLPALSTYENIALPLRLAGTKPQRGEIRDLLRRVGLDDMGRRRPAELSGGQQQRVAVARALATGPDVLFADEPTGALDTSTSRQVMELLRQATEHDGQTVVMVSHDPSAAAYADVVVFLEDGLIAGSLRGASAGEIAAAMSELET
jgi:putative ABC transport system ATP-binding protein